MSTTAVAAKARDTGPAKAPISPVKLAHFVLRTSRYQEIIDWYRTVLGAHVVFGNDLLSFMTYDDEHHRVAIINMPDLADQAEGVAGVHHLAFTFASLGDLLLNYERLKGQGIRPILSINHGPTTSLYYADPDGNQIECQVDNFDRIEDASAFFYSDAFAENPIGVDLDPDELLRRWRAGEPDDKLKVRPPSGPRGLEGSALR